MSDLKIVASRNMVLQQDSLLVSGRVSYDCSTDLYVILNGDLTGVHYPAEIIEALMCTLMLVLGAKTLCLLMETPVRTRLVLLMSTFSVKGIQHMGWPVPSPVNPIEHVWNLLQQRISARPAQPQSREDLKQALIQEWARIPCPAIRKLIRNFILMCRVVNDTRGGQAPYLINLVCDFKHVTLLFVKFHAPPNDMQMFKFRQGPHLLIPHV